MFGYAVADPNNLNDEQRERYRCVYCGLCREIGKVGRPLDRLSLTYDLVLLILVLSDVHETAFSEVKTRCIKRPVRPRRILVNKWTSFAAQMNILLAYYKFLDDKNDDGGLVSSVMTALFEKEAAAVAEHYPKLSAEIKSCLAEIGRAEAENVTDPDIPANAFGAMLGSLFTQTPSDSSHAYGKDTEQALYAFGFTLGKAIYLMDAAADLKEDLRKQAYNPFVRSSHDHRIRLIESVLAQCLDAFYKLKMKTHGDIVENVLLSGIWRVYDLKTTGKGKKRELPEEDRKKEAAE